MNEATSLRPGTSSAGFAELAGWLANTGLRNMPLEQMVDGFCLRLNQMGIAVARTFVGINTLHPMIRARSMIWDRTTGPSVKFEFNHADIGNLVWRQSPFARMLRDGVTEERHRLTDAKAIPPEPVFVELHGAGMTEWLGVTFPFGEREMQVGPAGEVDAASQLGLVCSLATDRPGGFSTDDLALLRQLLPIFAVAIKGTTMRSIGRGLLATYLGTDPADRVLAGTIMRGEVQSVEAVLFFADLRDFTRLADIMPGRELIAMLDDYFDCMARPVVKRGGEILKFMGDGLLATFGIGAALRADVCRTALDAASEAIAAVAALNANRTAAGQLIADLDLALHVGEVLYGNVGTDARLDFTVIGPAVNEASRIELLCKELGWNVLVSQEFAAAATYCRGRLSSVGRHRLRGVRDDTELFTLMAPT
jgi:adenylate cyclase